MYERIKAALEGLIGQNRCKEMKPEREALLYHHVGCVTRQCSSVEPLIHIWHH